MYYFASDIHLGAGGEAFAQQTERRFVRWLDDAAQDADLRRGEADTVRIDQSFGHVVEQLTQLSIKFRHRAADLGKAGVAHFMDLANSHNVVLFSLL